MTWATSPHFYTFTLNPCPSLWEKEWLGLKQSHFMDSSGCITWYLTPRQEPSYLSTLFMGSRKDQPKGLPPWSRKMYSAMSGLQHVSGGSWVNRLCHLPSQNRQNHAFMDTNFYFSIIYFLPPWNCAHNLHHYLFYYFCVCVYSPLSPGMIWESLQKEKTE